jgi:hypothetical protein
MKIFTFSKTLMLLTVCTLIGWAFTSYAHLQETGEPTAVLVKSTSPLVAQRLACAVENSDFGRSQYRLSLPSNSRMKGARVRGSLPTREIVQLERVVQANNRNFGKGAGDIIILVKVITKGSAAERLVREALQGLDQSLYQIEVVR